MNNLTHHEYGKILKAVEILNADIDPQSLPKRMINAVNTAVSSDIASFEMLSPAGEYLGCLIYEPLDSVSGQELEAYAAHVNEHPIFNAIVFKQRFDAIRISDFVSDAKFKLSGLYNEFYRPVGVSRQITVTMKISDECIMLCTLSRPGQDFDELEKSVLNLMSPHFTAAVRCANQFGKLEIEGQNWQTVAESMGRTIINLDRTGAVKFVSEKSAELLKKYFAVEKLKVRGLPNLLYQWVIKTINESIGSDEFHLPPKSLVISAGAEKLTVQFCVSTADDSVNLILFEEKAFSPENLRHFGLTKRESEISYLIACGKSNPEIAILCDISPRTVHKHVEHIFTKLGVETRTAAAMRVSEFIWSLWIFISGFGFAAQFQ